MNRQRMIEVFKTDVLHEWEANELLEILLRNFAGCKINFDLDDCDKVLRVEGIQFNTDEIKMIVNENGFLCENLE